MQVVRSGWILAALAACCGCRELRIHDNGGPARVAAPAVPTAAPVMPAASRHETPLPTRHRESRGFAAGVRIAGTRVQPPEGVEPNGRAKFSTVAATDAGIDALPWEEFEDRSADSDGIVPASSVSLLTEVPDNTPPGSVPMAFPLTLDQAIATGLNRNPDLVSLRAGEPIARAAFHVAETYPWNPFVQIQVLPYGRDPSGDTLGVNHYVWLMQTLELAHQGRHREAGAAASLNQVRWNIVQAELTNTAQTERLYFSALYQRDLRDLADRAAALNSDLLGVVERRFNAGLATSAELTTAQVSARQARKQASLAAANFQTALLALQRQLNLPAGQQLTLVGQLQDFDWLPVSGVDSNGAGVSGPIQVSDQVTWRLACERPDVLAAQSGTSAARSAADLARANQVPNFGIGPFYERDEVGVVFAGFRTQMNLPVWDSGRPLTQQRNAEARQQWIAAQQICSRAQVEIQTAMERYERARRLVERERAESTDMQPDELETMKDLFEEGQASILAVFATQTSLLQEERTYLDLLNEAAQAAADVTLTAGLPPARVVLGNRGPTPVPPASSPDR